MKQTYNVSFSATISSGVLGQAFGVNPQVFSSLPKLRETIAPPRNVSGPAAANVVVGFAASPAQAPTASATGGNGTANSSAAIRTASSPE
jgi:hypothetical protein